VSRRAPDIVDLVEPPPPAGDASAVDADLDDEPRVPRADRLRAIGYSVFLYVASITVALGIASIIVLLTHGSPHAVFSALYKGSFASWGSFGYTLDYAAPLLMVAVGTIVAVRAGFFNIGQEGQLAIGAMCAGFVALKVHPASWWVLVLALLAGAAGGAVWAGIAALLKFWRGIDVVISSLLLIYIALSGVLPYTLHSSSLLRESTAGAQLDESAQLPGRVQLAHIGSYPHFNIGIGMILALVLALVIAIVMTRTRWGFAFRMLGHNPTAARRAGISAVVLGSVALMISGATAGFAGAVVLTGQQYRLTPVISNNIGWTGLLVALVARNNAAVAIAVSLFFGGLAAGGGFVQSTGVPGDIVNIIVALLVLAAVFPPAWQQFRASRRTRLQSASPPRTDAVVPA
jgi:simple sugar transport system permease protein